MSERRCGVDEDLLDIGSAGKRTPGRRHIRHISMLLFVLIALALLSVYLLSRYNTTPVAPGQDQVGPGRNIGQ